MNTPIHLGGSLWYSFRDAFVTAMLAADTDQLVEAWSSQTARTTFHRGQLLGAVASTLGLTVVPELFKVDFAMAAASSSGELVPSIFIESENVAISAEHEIRKLTVLATPLRVLVTVCEWSDIWDSGGLRTSLLPKWQEIMRAHSDMWPHPGWLGIVVGEWGQDNHLRFYTIGLGPNGEIRDEQVYDRFMGENAE